MGSLARIDLVAVGGTSAANLKLLPQTSWPGNGRICPSPGHAAEYDDDEGPPSSGAPVRS